MVLLAQISDPHLGPLPPASRAELLSKRAIGYLNWQRNRVRRHDDALLAALVDDMRAAQPDHVAVTGDLVNLGLPAEYAAARKWLETLGEPDRVTVIPGNHDAYVPGALDHARDAWREYMSGDGADTVAFPFVRRRGLLALIGMSTAVASPPLMATGAVGDSQAAALEAALAETGREGRFRVVLIHHPPIGTRHWYRRLTDAGRVREAIARAGAELVLHGHDHRVGLRSLPGRDGPVPVIGATAASLRRGPRHIGGIWNLFRIEGEPGAWNMAMSERGVSDAGSIETVGERKWQLGGGQSAAAGG